MLTNLYAVKYCILKIKILAKIYLIKKSVFKNAINLFIIKYLLLWKTIMAVSKNQNC